jgi:hypothetical protein
VDEQGNPIVGSTRIHGELLMSWDRGRPINRGEVYDQKAGASFPGLEAFLRNHAPETASIDLFVVRTISFKLLYGLVILRHARRRLVSISVTNSPTAEWIAGQVTDAFS